MIIYLFFDGQVKKNERTATLRTNVYSKHCTGSAKLIFSVFPNSWTF